MTDLRVLAMALIGWFLALALGLVLGSTLGTPDRRDRVYEGLRSQFELLRSENQQVRLDSDKARRRFESMEQGLREVMPGVVRGRLDGMSVAVFLVGPIDEGRFRGEFERAVQDAGGTLGPILRIADRPSVLPLELRERLGKQLARGTPPETPAPFEAVTWLIHGLARGESPQALAELTRASGVELRNYSGAPVRKVLLVIPAEDERLMQLENGDTPELAVVDAALEEGIRLVAAEPLEPGSALAPVSRRGVPTVDAIDTSLGQIAAVLALAGVDGSYGMKPGAGRALPSLHGP